MGRRLASTSAALGTSIILRTMDVGPGGEGQGTPEQTGSLRDLEDHLASGMAGFDHLVGRSYIGEWKHL